MNYISESIIFLCWWKLLIKLLFQNQYLSLTQVFSSFYQFHLWNQKRECFRTFMIECPKSFMRKEATRNLSPSLFLLSLWNDLNTLWHGKHDS